MKKRYLIAGATVGVTGALVAAKLLTRPREMDWEKHGGHLRDAGHSRFVEIDGMRVHYQEAGDKSNPAILLVHGFCASSLMWRDVLEPIAARGFRVVAPDLVGFGFSEKPRAWDYTIEAQARLLVRLLDELGIERASLVGSSYGGAVAATCTLDYTERVNCLALVDAVSNDDVKRQLLLRLGATRLMGEVVAPLVLGSTSLMGRRMRQAYAPSNAHLFDDGRKALQLLPLRAASTQRAVLKTLRCWNAARIEQEAHRIKQPVLLVWGDEDKDVPLANGERLHALIPHSRLIVFRDCGHLPQEERAPEFVELVAEFSKAVTSDK